MCPWVIEALNLGNFGYTVIEHLGQIVSILAFTEYHVVGLLSMV